MEIKVLIAYASIHGSTQEVAEAVATTIRTLRFTVDLKPVRSVQTLAGYQAVVLGAPMYMFKLHKDTFRFLSRFKDNIAMGTPVAVFAGGPFGEATPQVWQKVRQNLDQELAKVSWFTPISVLVVGGKFDPNSLRFPYNLIPAMRQMPPSDLRDWEAIRYWASSLVTQLQPD